MDDGKNCSSADGGPSTNLRTLTCKFMVRAPKYPEATGAPRKICFARKKGGQSDAQLHHERFDLMAIG
jgi:hypothetical protein